MSNATSSSLTALLPSSSYTLAYALPLLLLSLVLTFAGTFLTLDRSRAFPPSADAAARTYAALPVPGAFNHHGKKKGRRWVFLLEGGVGGMVGGFAFGVHLSTFLALLIPATTSSSPLSPKSFLAVWLLSSLCTMLLAARYHYAAYLFISISGGSLTALSLSVLLHPSLPTRLVLLAILTSLLPLLLLLSLLPRLAARLRHPTLRLCTAATGAFGMVIAIALLTSPAVSPWADVWQRLWIRDGEGWGTGRERALSAAWGVFFVFGMAADWALRRWLGECPDEKWDSYLAKYARDLPNQPGRLGTFQPLTSVWDRLFPSSESALDSKVAPILFPDTAEPKKHPLVSSSGSSTPPPLMTPFLLNMPTATPGKLHKQGKEGEKEEGVDKIPSAAAFLRKKNTRKFGFGGQRKPVRFGEDLGDSSDDDDGEQEKKQPRAWMIEHQRVQFLPSLSYSSESPTLVDGTDPKAVKPSSGITKPLSKSPLNTDVDPTKIDYDADLARLGKWRAGLGEGEGVEYSDYEDDGDLGLSPMKEGEGQAKWSPKFMQTQRTQSVVAAPPSAFAAPVAAGALPVPATPSLIRALDRIKEAQREVFGASASTPAAAGTQAAPKPAPAPAPARRQTALAPTPVRRQTADTRRPNPVPTPTRRQTADAPGLPPRTVSSPAAPTPTPTPTPRAPGAGASSPNLPTANEDEDEDEEIDLEQALPSAKEERAPRWEEFWREVRAKART